MKPQAVVRGSFAGGTDRDRIERLFYGILPNSHKVGLLCRRNGRTRLQSGMVLLQRTIACLTFSLGSSLGQLLWHLGRDVPQHHQSLIARGLRCVKCADTKQKMPCLFTSMLQSCRSGSGLRASQAFPRQAHRCPRNAVLFPQPRHHGAPLSGTTLTVLLG
jgi:hypothetical protein